MKKHGAAICPECRAGKCGNCTGMALDEVTEAWTTCTCKH